MAQRHWDFSEARLGMWEYIDTDGVRHDGAPDDVEELGHVDIARVFIVYPDGSSDTRWFAGPWGTWEDFEHDVELWYEEGTP